MMIPSSSVFIFLSFETVGGFSSASIVWSTTRATPLTTGDKWKGTRTNQYSEQPSVFFSTLLKDHHTDASTGGFNTVLSDEIRKELQSQNPNENAPPYDYFERGGEDEGENSMKTENESLQSMIELDESTLEDHKHAIHHDHYETRSLDDLFPNKKSLGFSQIFNSCAPFRNELRDAMRYDMIFDSNADGGESIKNQPPIYGSMTSEQRHHQLAKNKPLIGYWKHDNGGDDDDDSDAATNGNFIRMKRTTEILSRYLGSDAPTGDSFFEAIGSLCNSTQAPYHWTEVVGVAATQNNKMGDKTEHAWHQDYGHLQDRKPINHDQTTKQGQKNDDSTAIHDSYPYQSNNHVFLAFPYEDNYHGTGVFSHLIKLKFEQWAKPKGQLAPGKSIFYNGTIPDRYIVRPIYVPGCELVIFRDIDVLHSTPDIQYRTSIMRFG